ncbi:transposase, partial [Bifidobacterium hapali]
MTPDDIDVWVGLDVGKSAHHAHALDHDGNTLYDKPLKQDEKAIRTMLEKLSRRGRVLLVVDQPNTIGSLPLTVARSMGVQVAYLPGTAMRRTAQLLPGTAKTDRRDAYVIAWAALKIPESLRDAGPDDETLAALKILAGHDEDLAHESTRHINRLRSLLLQTHPAFERVLKGERVTRDATLALLERYGGPMGMREAGIEQVRRWAKDKGIRAERIIDDMFKAIGEQTVTVPGTDMAETIIPSIARDIKQIKDRRRNLASQVEELLNDHPLLTVLTSMPGIGARTASNILLAIGGNIS